MTKKTISTGNRSWQIEFPKRCTICHHLVNITGFETHKILNESSAEVIISCPNPDCQHMFMVFYVLDNKGASQIKRIIPYEPSPEELPNVIKEVSPKFVEIYTEAIEAKDAGLMQIY